MLPAVSRCLLPVAAAAKAALTLLQMLTNSKGGADKGVYFQQIM